MMVGRSVFRPRNFFSEVCPEHLDHLLCGIGGSHNLLQRAARVALGDDDLVGQHTERIVDMRVVEQWECLATHHIGIVLAHSSYHHHARGGLAHHVAPAAAEPVPHGASRSANRSRPGASRRNREGKTYAVVRDYLQRNDSRCILCSTVEPHR